MVDRKEEILKQYFVNAKDVKELTGFGINECRNIVKIARQKMAQDGCYITRTRPLEAMTTYVLEMLGVKKI